ncbi:MAG: hypothetical protein GX633_02430 [Clostridiales bacterium]|nr:hypothetical protein [Clostridiales bacterium]
MKGIEKIIDRIADSSNAEYEAIIDKAVAEAEEIISQGKKTIEDQCDIIIDEANKESSEIIRRAVSMAYLEARKKKLETKQVVIDKAFTAAVESILSMPANEYQALLVSLAVNAGKDGGEVIFSASDRTKFGKQVVIAANEKLNGSSLTLSVETRDIPGGLIVKNGSIEINCDIQALIKFSRDELSIGVAKILF